MRFRAFAISLLLLTGACSSMTHPAKPAAQQTVVVHASRALPGTLQESLGKMNGVQWTRTSTSAMVNLVRVDGGLPLPARAPGGTLPFSIAAAEPLPDPSDLVSAVLAKGQAVIPPVTARLRSVGLGSKILIGLGMERALLEIGAVVDDPRVEGVEALIPMSVARTLGVKDVRDVVVGVESAHAGSLEQAASSLAAPIPVRVGTADDAIRSPAGGRILSLAQIKERFGEFTFVRGAGRWLEPDPAWVALNITEDVVPLLGLIKCNARIMPLIIDAMHELEKAGLSSLIKEPGGCYSPRVQFGDALNISRHTWGIAVDINESTNQYGDVPTQDLRLIAIMSRHGFAWGGPWLVPDGMHFEYVGSDQGS